MEKIKDLKVKKNDKQGTKKRIETSNAKDAYKQMNHVSFQENFKFLMGHFQTEVTESQLNSQGE